MREIKKKREICLQAEKRREREMKQREKQRKREREREIETYFLSVPSMGACPLGEITVHCQFHRQRPSTVRALTNAREVSKTPFYRFGVGGENELPQTQNMPDQLLTSPVRADNHTQTAFAVELHADRPGGG